MPRILIEIPAAMQKRIQDYYGIQGVNIHAKLYVEGKINAEGFENDAPWMNGHVVPAKIANPIVKNNLDDEVDALVAQIKAEQSKPAVTRPLPDYWASDERLKADLPAAIKVFRRDCPKFWKDKYSPNGKPLINDLQGVINFLEDNENVKTYDQLSADQWNYMCFIRKVHRNWWQATHK